MKFTELESCLLPSKAAWVAHLCWPAERKRLVLETALPPCGISSVWATETGYNTAGNDATYYKLYKSVASLPAML